MRRAAAALLALLVAGTAVAGAAAARSAIRHAAFVTPNSTLVRLDAPLSVCLDGSPAGYFVRPGRGAGAHKWYIHHEGGGWCQLEKPYQVQFHDDIQQPPWPPLRAANKPACHLNTSAPAPVQRLPARALARALTRVVARRLQLLTLPSRIPPAAAAHFQQSWPNDNCLARSRTHLGTLAADPETAKWDLAYSSADPTVNPRRR